MDGEITGVSGVNGDGDLALFIDALPDGSPPTSVSRSGDRLAVLSSGRPVNVRVYARRAGEAARGAGHVLVVEVDARDGSAVRHTDVPVEDEGLPLKVQHSLRGR